MGIKALREEVWGESADMSVKGENTVAVRG